MASLFGKFQSARSVPLESAPTTAAVQPYAEPYADGDGRIGVLLCHGFTGSVRSMRPWADHLVQAGYRVSAPRLPGHGTSWPELNRTQWTDWYGEVDRAFTDLRAECDQVFLGGLSMGAALCLRLAQQHGAEVSGLALVNPVVKIADPRIHILPILMRLFPSLGAIANDIAAPGVDEGAYDRNPLRALHSQTFLWADVRAHLAEVTQPLLVFHSRVDHVVDPSSVTLLRGAVGSTDATYVTLARSYHVATLDYDAAEIFQGSSDFFSRLTRVWPE